MKMILLIGYNKTSYYNINYFLKLLLIKDEII